MIIVIIYLQVFYLIIFFHLKKYFKQLIIYEIGPKLGPTCESIFFQQRMGKENRPQHDGGFLDIYGKNK